LRGFVSSSLSIVGYGYTYLKLLLFHGLTMIPMIFGMTPHPHEMANQLGLPHLSGHLPGGTGSGASLEEGGDLPAAFVNGSSVQLEKTTLWETYKKLLNIAINSRFTH
jgi:hypothetical protein